MGKYLLVLLAGLFCASSLLAQNGTGTIVGHVADNTGAAVNNATVTITNIDTQETRSSTTNEVGNYAVPLLKPGNYRVTVAARGFKTETTSGIVLNVDQTARFDTVLSVGATTETLTVTADALSLDTENGAIGQLITGEQIAELPLNGRNFQDLMFLSPGAVNNPGGNQSAGRLTISGSGTSAVSLGGSRGASEGYTVDGTSIEDVGFGTPAFGPSLDDIAEFNELTKSYSAAYGFSLNQINITSKSGTNNFHGTAFEFLRNSAVDAPFHGYVPSQGALPLLQQNQFGFALGGPVWIPKVYNGRNKTFFFANFEGFRQNTGGQATPQSVPLADEMNGKFDADVLGNFTTAQLGVGGTLTQCGHTYQVGDPHPLFNPFDPNGCPFAAAADGSYTIPGGSISKLGKLIMTPGIYYPAGPNTTGPSIGVQNYLFASKGLYNFNQQNYRIDQSIGAKDLIFFHLTWHDESQTATSYTPANATSQTQPGRLYTATETHTFSPSLTNQLRIGISHAKWVREPAGTITPEVLSSLSFPSVFTAPGENYPRIAFDSSNLNDGLTYNGGGAYVGGLASSVTQNRDYSDSATWNVKRHTLTFGFQGRNVRYIPIYNPGIGRINYNGQYSGDDFADALLGAGAAVDLVELGPLSNPLVNPGSHLHFNSWAPYVQDDWKANDRLTLNLGLRYEYIATPFEEQNSFLWADFNAPGGALYIANPKIAAAYGGVNPFDPSTGLYVPAPNGMRGAGPAEKDVFAPRVGFAYRLFGNDKTVLRGGFGKYFDTIEIDEYAASANGIYPSTSTVNSGNDAPLSYPPAFNTNALPQAAAGAAPLVSYATNPSTSTLGFVQTQGDHTLNPYYLTWNLGVERELPWATKLEVDYIGNHGTHLFSRSNPNAPVECIAINGCTVTATTPATVPVAARTPYMNLGMLVYAGFDGFANYNAMDVKVEHRAKDLDMVVAYTWSKALDTKSSVGSIGGDDAGWAGPQDGHNIAADYGRGNFDIRQRLAISAVYPLPIGKGKALLGNSSSLVDEAIGGWKFGVISSLQGGIPFTIGAQDIQGANSTYSERANINPIPAGFHQSLAKQFIYDSTPGSTDAQYTQPAPGYFGDSRRDAQSSPGQINADFSLAKDFPIWEKTNFEFRFDAFNAFNHWNPGQPGLVQDATNKALYNGYIAPTDSQSSARVLQISGHITF